MCLGKILKEKRTYMATRTNFSQKKLNGILSNYSLGKLIDSQPFTTGTVQTNWRLQTTTGDYVFRYYEKCRSQDSVLFEVNLMRYLKKRHYPCPTPFNNKYGKPISLYNNKPYVIFEFIEGEHLEMPNWDQKKELIRMVAKLHNITKNYRPSNKSQRWNYGIDLCRNLANKQAEKINTVNSQRKLKWFESELQKLNLPKSLPKGVCHCDFHFSNVLFLNGKFNALIDFDDANYTFLIFDLVSLVEPFVSSFKHSNWFEHNVTDNIFDFGETKRIVSEYERYRFLNSNEKRHIFDVYKLSFLFDCIWYFDRGDAENFFEKRKIEHFNNLGADNFYNQLFT